MAKANSTRVRKPAAPTPKCKKGDLAIRLDKRYSGQIVEVGEYHGTVDFPENGGQVIFYAWKVLHPSYERGYSYYCEDKYLFPIRPGDLDESETGELSLVNGEAL
jgi:hypothetical protein